MPEPPSPPTPHPSARPVDGHLIAGRYRLDRLIATGGMAQVWEATDEVLTRKVAVKILHSHLAGDSSFLARFRAEAIAAARLAHPSIVSIYDTCSEDGVEAIVMELVRGTTLRHRLDEQGALDVRQAVAIVAHAADALAVAHRAGVVHRDIKPANILLANDGRVMVADFGIAKAGEDLTTEGTMLGTAKYLAPEQVAGGPIGPRTDVYALGIVLYEALCGRPPFAADTDAGTALARLHTEPLRPRQVRASVPKRVEDIVLRAMARDPEARFADAGELHAALLGLGLGDLSADPEPTAGSTGGGLDLTAAVAAGAPSPTPPGGAPRFTQTERSWLVPTALIVIVALSLGVAGVLFGTTDTGREFFDKVRGAATPKATPVQLAGATAYDPEGTGGEYDDRARLAIDGDPSTAWRTESYDQAGIVIKSGVGIYVTLAQAADLRDLTVTSPTPNWSAAVYVADATAPDVAGWGSPVVAHEGIAPGTTTFALDGAHGRYVLLWITNVGAPGAHVDISELSVTV